MEIKSLRIVKYLLR